MPNNLEKNHTRRERSRRLAKGPVWRYHGAMIRFDNFQPQYATVQHAVSEAVQRVLASGRYILGAEVEAFEQELAALVGCRHAVGVASGTEALALALLALGIGRGDDVLVPAVTAFPTATAVLQIGAVPRAVDILPESGLMDPADLERRITTRSRAVIPVHLYGQSCDLAAIQAIADRHGLAVVEDCAQSIGARYRGRVTGGIGHCGAFSFYPTKNLGAYGDGGAVTTDDPHCAERLKRLRNYGQADRYRHVEFGLNSRLDELQAAVLRAKLPFLPRWNERRRLHAQAYRGALRGVTVMREYEYGLPVYHLFAVRSPQRRELMEFLQQRGIQTLIHYPVPLHHQPAFPARRRERFPHAEQFCAEVFSLPLYPELEASAIGEVVQAVHDFVHP